MKCKCCKRELPNKKYITKQGCIWCDANYHILTNAENRAWDKFLEKFS